MMGKLSFLTASQYVIVTFMHSDLLNFDISSPPYCMPNAILDMQQEAIKQQRSQDGIFFPKLSSWGRCRPGKVTWERCFSSLVLSLMMEKTLFCCKQMWCISCFLWIIVFAAIHWFVCKPEVQYVSRKLNLSAFSGQSSVAPLDAKEKGDTSAWRTHALINYTNKTTTSLTHHLWFM